MKITITFLLTILLVIPVFSQSSLNLSANYETVGVSILLNTDDPEKDAYAELQYKLSTDLIWKTGFPLSRVDNNLLMCSGSIFWLSPSTSYDVKVQLFDATTSSLNGQYLQGTISTKAEPIFSNVTGSTYNVNPTGSGSFYTLQNAINLAQAGDVILLDTGNYYVGDITFPNNGNSSNPIEINGVDKDNVILNGAYETPLVWTPNGTNGVYYTTTPVKNPNLVIADGVRLYPHQTYPDLVNNRITLSYCFPLRTYPAEVGGFYRNPTMTPLINLCNISDNTFGDPPGINANKLYLKLVDGSDPNSKEIVVTQKANCLNFENNSNITVRNLTIKNYGLGHIATAVIISNSNNIIFDSCDFIANNTSIRLNNNTTNVLVQNCWFKDSFFNWNAWKIKGTQDGYAPFNSRFLYNSRNLEKGSLIYGNDFYGNNIVFRNNTIEDYHQGGHITPAPSGATNLATLRKSLEIDFYDNIISNCRGDGFELDGFARNIRVFRNTFKECHAPLSMAVAEEGPVYILRNTFYNIIPDYYDDGANLAEAKGHTLKFQGGNNQKNGDIFFFHNTVDAHNIAYGMNVYQVTTPNAWKTIESKNNNFSTDSGIPLNVRTLSGMPNFISDYNNYFSSNNDIACFNLNNSTQTCYPLLNTVFSTYSVEEHSLQQAPLFLNSSMEDYNLSQNSPLIDQGIIIQGINELDYNALNPDIGAFEYDNTLTVSEKSNSLIKIYPNPTNDIVFIEIDNNDPSNLFIYDITGNLIEKSEILREKTIDLSHLSNGIYLITIITSNKKFTTKIMKSR